MSRASPIAAVRYRNPRRPDLPVEILSLAALRAKAPPGYLARPQRPTFHQVHVVMRGQCALEVDFARVALDRDAVAWIHPGQVQRFDLHAGVDGWLVMFTADVVDRALVDEPVGPRIELGDARADIAWLLARMRRLCDEASGSEDRFPLLRHLLHAFLLVLRRRARTSSARPPASAVFALFRTEVERRFATTRQVEDYERRIGYSAKTLTRAARAATGMTAKQYIDQRVLLESRRLLAHTRLSVGDIAQRVGFSELTNFIKFFRRAGGESPAEFRRRAPG
jgi:AraC-like DNA-binding protein